MVYGFHEPHRIFDTHPTRAAGCNSLQILRAHNGADTRPPCCPVEVIDHRCISNALLSCYADRCNLQLRIRVSVPDPFLGIPDGCTPDFICRLQCNPFILYQ